MRAQLEWRDIPDWEGYYQVSNYGDVRSLDRVLVYQNGRRVRCRGQRLTPTLSHGYHRVELKRPGYTRSYGCHRLVAIAFLGGDRPELDVRHGDNVRTRNFVGNLSWGTRLENEADKRRHGTHHCTIKRLCNRGHVLIQPNLVPSKQSQNPDWRGCLACSRALSYVKYPPNAHLDVQILSDDYYRKIME